MGSTRSGISISPPSLTRRLLPLTKPFSTPKPFRSPVHNCSPLQDLKPKPHTHPRRPPPPPPAPSALCAQLEKLVFFKRYAEALKLFEIFQSTGGGRAAPISTYGHLVTIYTELRSVRAVKMVFRHMLETGLHFDRYMRNWVLLMHLKCDMLVDARNLFDEMPERNTVSGNLMVTGLVDSGAYEELEMFSVIWGEVSEGGSRMLATVVWVAAALGFVDVGRQVHCCAVKMGECESMFVCCALIGMDSKCRWIEEARWVFDEMPEKIDVGWNTIIAGYALLGYSEGALELYYKMCGSGVKMDHFTYSIVI